MTFEAINDIETLATPETNAANLSPIIARLAYKAACDEIGEIDYETITFPLAERAAQLIGLSVNDILEVI